MAWASWLDLLGPLSVAVALVVLAAVSRRFGRATRAGRTYLGFLIGALLVSVGVLAHLIVLIPNGMIPLAFEKDPTWVMLDVGLPAIGLTIALVAAWHYWSWLLAERG
jgi:hypothetical protein